jgi:RNA exonuclease 1
MIHKNIVDTSVVFPHKMGPPYKRSLKVITAEFIKRLIQNDGKFFPLRLSSYILLPNVVVFPVGGHDSAEDALACLDLMKLKIKEDAKKLQQMSKTPS